jgi:predicted DNA-binding protein (MmcQ/YjbR family)
MNLETLYFAMKGYKPVGRWYINFDEMMIKWESDNALDYSKIRQSGKRWYYLNKRTWCSFGANKVDADNHNPIINEAYKEWRKEKNADSKR